MIPVILAAALHLSPVVIMQTRPSAPSARYIRLEMKADGYGIRGDGSILVDRQNGRYVERLNVGPASFSQGFDGQRAWLADASGTPAIQGNPIARGNIMAWGYLFAFPRGSLVRSSVHYSDIPQAVSLAFHPDNHHVTRFSIFNGSFFAVANFSGYRSFENGIIAPQSISFRDDNGTWRAHVSTVREMSDVPADAFAPPQPRHDAAIRGGATSVHFLVATLIIIPVSINNGPQMHFILDTGGQNVLSEDTVKRLGLRALGQATVSGAGAGVVPTRFVEVKSVRIGAAVMRDQSFLVIDSPILNGIDGIVGFEMLSRFAARIDYRTNTLSLATTLPNDWLGGTQATAFTFRSRQPEVDGSIDGFRGLMTIDSGNSGAVDVNSPFAVSHNLWKFYHAAKPGEGSLAGVGGKVLSADITIRRFQLGTAKLENVFGDLTRATEGIESDPSFAANVGEGIFRNFNFALDYPHQHLYFAPGGIVDMSGVFFEQRGRHIVVSQVVTRRAREAGIRPGMELTRLDGRRVGASDLAWVQAQLKGREAGSLVHMVFNGNKRVTLMLLNYL